MDLSQIEFLKSVLKKNSLQNGECIEWTGHLSTAGYGYLYAFKKNWTAHRASFLVEHGCLPVDLYICHKCNNKKCINPQHLYAGTAKDNYNDYKNSWYYPQRFDQEIKEKRRKEKENLELKTK